VRKCLRLASAPHADATVQLINKLGRRRRILRTGAGVASAEKLPVLHKAQLAQTWRSGKPLVAIGVQSGLDKAAAAILGALAEMHGIHTRVERSSGARGKSREARSFKRSPYLSLLHRHEKSDPHS